MGVISYEISRYNSELQGQEEAATSPLSELFTCSTAQKFTNAVAKPLYNSYVYRLAIIRIYNIMDIAHI